MIFICPLLNIDMQYNQIINEAGSRGLFVRTQNAAAGDTVIFTNDQGQQITAVGNAVFPVDGFFFENDTVNNLPSQARKLAPVEQKKLLKTGFQKVSEALEQYQIKMKIKSQNWHVVNNNGRAALVTLWKKDNGDLVGFIKLFNIKSAGAVPFFWSNSDFARDTTYSIRDNAQQKTDLNLKPSTVVGIGERLTVEEAVEQIGVNISTHTEIPADVRKQIIGLIKNVESGFATPVANAAANATSFEVDLGETAAPIALLTGHFISGSYREVEEQLLKPQGSSWRKIKTFTFPMSGTEALVDSYLNLSKDVHIGISSKNSTGGASASVTSLTSVIEKNPERFVDLQSEKKYKYLFNIMNLIKDKSAEDGPLELGVLYKIITKDEKKEIKNAIADLNIDKKYLSKTLKSLLKNSIYNPVTVNQNYTIGYHLLTTVAFLVTAHLNKNSNLVTAFFKEILSRSNMIQVKTKMKIVDTGAYFSNFEVMWPPAFPGKVQFFAQKNYSASAKPGGKICFKIG
jgi:hypothetical protein